MNRLLRLLTIVLAGIALAAGNAPESRGDAISVPMKMNYQGRLTDSAGNPVTGTRDMTFRLYSGGTQFWVETQLGVSVNDGLFNVLLGRSVPITSPPENGNCSLEVSVAGTVIVPRIPVVSVGYSFVAQRAEDANLLGGISAASYVRRPVTTGDLADNAVDSTKLINAAVTMSKLSPSGAAPGEVIKWTGSAWAPGTDYTGSGSVTTINQGVGVICSPNPIVSAGAVALDPVISGWVRSGANDSVLATARHLGIARGSCGNRLYDSAQTQTNLGVQCTTRYAGAAVSGGRGNCATALYAVAAGGRRNLVGGDLSASGGGENNSVGGSRATVAGGSGNAAGSNYAFVGGGYGNLSNYAAAVGGGSINAARGDFAAVIGGYNNQATGTAAVVGGGTNNSSNGVASVTVGGNFNQAGYGYATVGGGLSNTAGHDYATVCGGDSNRATGFAAGIGGGWRNVASGSRSTVSGGWFNAALASGATVAGGQCDTAWADWAFAAGYRSIVPAGCNNSAAFNGAVATAASQLRCGLLSKSGGTFTIDHPIDPAHMILNHYFVESPDMSNIYSGSAVLDAAGRAEVGLPDYFDALNGNPRVQLTGVGTSEVYVFEKVKGNRFVIGGRPGTEVFWQVTGDRKDPSAQAIRYLMPVEQPKTGALTGRSMDDDFLVGCLNQLERMGKAGEFSFRTAAGRQRYEEMQGVLRSGVNR